MGALFCIIISVYQFHPGKEVHNCHVILLFCRVPSLKKYYVGALQEFTLFHQLDNFRLKKGGEFK